jgi:hypothetical protein
MAIRVRLGKPAAPCEEVAPGAPTFAGLARRDAVIHIAARTRRKPRRRTIPFDARRGREDVMSERGVSCAIGEDAPFARLAAAARPFTRSETAAFLAELGEAIRREAALRDDPGGDEIDRSRATFEKWRLLHRWARRHPYRDRLRAERSDVWREALDRFRPLRDSELIDWLALQIEVAANIEKGVADMRPRDPGPTWLVTLEHVSNRKRKALAVLHWAQAARGDAGPDADPEPRRRAWSAGAADPARFGRGAGGHEGAPWPLDEEE